MHPFKHLHTILRHRRLVRYHARRVGIRWQGWKHDLSKFSPTEFWAGAKYYEGTHSPNEGEREDLGYSVAWMHHKGRNRHHYEWWVDIDPVTHEYRAAEMPVNYLAEMFCDRLAASKVYHGKAYSDRDPLEYFEKKRAKNNMHPANVAMLRVWLTTLAEEGERAAHRVVKAAVKQARRDRKQAKRDRKKKKKDTTRPE